MAAVAPLTMDREPRQGALHSVVAVPATEAPKPICDSDKEASEWADMWWKGYKDRVRPHDSGFYFDPSGLFDLLEAGAGGKPAPVKLLKLSWVLKRAAKLRHARTLAKKQALAMPRRQQLEIDEPGAFLTAAEVRALPRGHGHDQPLRILSISHGWLTPQHPDPYGEQLVNFAAQIAKERSWFRGTCCRNFQVACAWVVCCGCLNDCCCWVIPCHDAGWGKCWYQLPDGEFGVFYDYGSLMQKEYAAAH